MSPQLQCNSWTKIIAVLTFLKAVKILEQNWINTVFEKQYPGILHQREKQAGLSTAHNGGITHHLSATSPEAMRKNIHVNKPNFLQNTIS